MRGLAADDELSSLRRELADVRAELAMVRRQIAAPNGVDNDRYPSEPRPTMHDLEDWVVSFMQDTLERRASNTRRWCTQWYKHPEVISRFWVLFHSYQEIVRSGDAVAYSAWYVEHLDRHLDSITSSDGPFAACSIERHTPHRGLVVSRNPNAETDWLPRPRLTTHLSRPAPRTAEVNR